MSLSQIFILRALEQSCIPRALEQIGKAHFFVTPQQQSNRFTIYHKYMANSAGKMLEDILTTKAPDEAAAEKNLKKQKFKFMTQAVIELNGIRTLDLEAKIAELEARADTDLELRVAEAKLITEQVKAMQAELTKKNIFTIYHFESSSVLFPYLSAWKEKEKEKENGKTKNANETETETETELRNKFIENTNELRELCNKFNGP